MTTLILIALSLVVGFVAGALVFRKHRAKLESAESKGRSLLDSLKGK
jgi:uncharacterized membrane-anchored protein YhcB (DUF1043 family)